MNIALWVVQIVLALAFGFAGFMKLSFPIEQLAAQMIWPGDIPEKLVRFIGGCELSASIGLIIPSLIRVRPDLTAWAATGLVLVMMFAIVFHITRGEYFAIVVNCTLGAMAFFVAWGRFNKVPILPRRGGAL